jgi:hypothetical protein
MRQQWASFDRLPAWVTEEARRVLVPGGNRLGEVRAIATPTQGAHDRGFRTNVIELEGRPNHAPFDIYFLEIMLCTMGDGLRRTAVMA